MNTSSTFVAADGEGYELTMGRWSRRLAVPFLDFVGTADGERALDVGCGTGHLAAAVATKTIPIVMVGVSDPVALGLVASLSRPGGNATGTSGMFSEAAGKRLQLFARCNSGQTE